MVALVERDLRQITIQEEHNRVCAQQNAILAPGYFDSDSDSSDTARANSSDDGSFTVLPGGGIDLQDLRIGTPVPEAPAVAWSSQRYADAGQAQQFEIAQQYQANRSQIPRALQSQLRRTARALSWTHDDTNAGVLNLRTAAHYRIGRAVDTGPLSSSSESGPATAVPVLMRFRSQALYSGGYHGYFTDDSEGDDGDDEGGDDDDWTGGSDTEGNLPFS
ncbi:hypothetical protein DXG01_015800 [Tephrocybe rancida]|nr:hypothetical protein DXG01_015800 [Tephrocybe rancida]